MPELLTPPRRHEWLGPAAEAPAITVRYVGSEIWISREARLYAGAWLRNVGSEVARRIEIPDLSLGDGAWCRFDPIDDLEPGEEASLDPVFCLDADKNQLEPATLTGAISKAIVSQVLAGRAPSREWAIEVRYQGTGTDEYVSRCEIQLAGLPLTLRVSPTRVSMADGLVPPKLVE